MSRIASLTWTTIDGSQNTRIDNGLLSIQPVNPAKPEKGAVFTFAPDEPNDVNPADGRFPSNMFATAELGRAVLDSAYPKDGADISYGTLMTSGFHYQPQDNGTQVGTRETADGFFFIIHDGQSLILIHESKADESWIPLMRMNLNVGPSYLRQHIQWPVFMNNFDDVVRIAVDAAKYAEDHGLIDAIPYRNAA